jgi:Putative virion core protein (lumpy skin disease virus)
MAIIDVVKYNGASDVLAWKYPSEELSTWTQLIVNESQEAVLFKSGVALDVFGCGKYTLDTDNIPVLKNLINLPFGNRSPFAAEVWFVNKAFTLDIKWGTATPIQIQDPKYGILVPVRSFGQFGITIKDSKKFLVKLVGTLSVFSAENLSEFFRGLFITKAKDTLSSYFVHKQISVVEINAYLDEISEYIKERLKPTLEDYGIELTSFYVNDISVPENDPAMVKLRDALAKRAEMDIIGYDYKKERTFNTLEGAAKNTSSGAAGFMGAGLGVGIGNAIGSKIGDMAKEAINAAESLECPQCHKKIDKGMRFCPECGFKIQSGSDKNLVKCSSCGALFDKTSKFCPECGDKYDACPKCGADLPEGALKCLSCGYEIQYCPKCGKQVKDNSKKFCSECGAAFPVKAL